jgi:hypothetical protein
LCETLASREIINGHNKILIDNIASELIVIENAVDQNDINDNEVLPTTTWPLFTVFLSRWN